tara:strand:- start:645 stop:2810 length:2166 start_codon:yes stop_codon:yes gene_type:complete
MKKTLLNFIGVKFFLILLLGLGLNSNLYSSENKFCLENDGFISPIVDQKTSCNVILTVSEFKYLINKENKDRLKNLKEFRKIAKKNSVKEKVINKEDVKKISKEIIQKSTLEQNRLKRLAENKQKRIDNQKKLIEKRLLVKRKNEKKRLKRSQELAKRKQEKIKKKLLLDQARKDKIKERKQKLEAAKKERQEKLNKRKKSLVAKKVLKENKNIVSQPIIVSNDFKVIYYEKQIVKKELFPSITKDIDTWKSKKIIYETSKDLNIPFLKDLTKTNKNFYILIPKDFDAFSNNVSQNQMMSKVVSGIRQVPNPDFTRLEAEIRDKERRSIMAKREAEKYEQRLNDPYRQSSGIGWLDVLSVVAETSGSIKYWNNYKDLQNQVSNLVNEYSNTPMTIDRKMYSSYNYTINNINSEKKVSYDILIYQNKNFFKKNFEIKESKKFKIASGLNSQDENYNSLIKKYHSENNLNSWNNKKIESQQLSKLLTKVFNENEMMQQISNKEAYKMLDSSYVEEEKSFWRSLFSSKKKERKIASLPKNNNYEILDARFNSVVVVKTGSGLGSGFYVNDDEIITNYHVIENANNITVIDKDKKRSSAVVIKKDLKRDLALLKTNAKGKKVSFYQGAIKQGSKVDALGHPRGKKFSISQGIVSAIRKDSSVYNVSRSDNVLFIQTDAAINKGNSGGPLFLGNKVVGVNTQGLSKKTSEGMNFAVHFSEVLDFLK